MRRITVVSLALALCLWALACSSDKPRMSSRVYSMGEPVPVGPLIYTILDSQWFDQLGDSPNVRLPQKRFLAIQLSVTNSGATPSGMPPLSLLDPQGTAFEELTNGEGLTDWLGAFRDIKPAQTARGRILFDVAAGSYRLRLASEAEPGSERMAMVDVPMRFEPATPPPATVPPAQP
jgi:hypothetical protein